MSVKVQYFSTKQSILLFAVAILTLPALLTNLGMVAFYDDEGIRALVALEMDISGNYITPTMFGEYYYNKPPLYNWILLAVFKLFGSTSEFTCRAVTVFFLLIFGCSVFYFFRKNFTVNQAKDSPFTIHYLSLLSALALLTCGRILFWDSILGLIDICFSWVMFMLFMVIFQEGEKESYGRLFGYSYLLGAIGFMLKGLPAVVFLGLALLTYFVWQKKIRHLFSWAHVAGGVVFTAIVGGYYFLYSQQNGLDTVLDTLFQESAKRTFVEYGLSDTILHFFTFPFEMWGHFLPWTLLIVCAFGVRLGHPPSPPQGGIASPPLRGARGVKWLRQISHAMPDKFLQWNALVLIVTVLPYWSSVEVYPRYLFMHVPLVFSILFYFYLKNKEEDGRMARMVELIFFGATCLAAVAALGLIFWDKFENTPLLNAKSIGLAIGMSVLAWLFWHWQRERMLVFVLVLLMARLGFNWFVLPTRLEVECSTMVRETSLKAVEVAGDHPIYIFKNSLGFQPATGYYFTRETGEILTRSYDKVDPEAYYIIHPQGFSTRPFEKALDLKIKWECGELFFGRLKQQE